MASIFTFSREPEVGRIVRPGEFIVPVRDGKLLPLFVRVRALECNVWPRQATELHLHT